MKLFSQGKEKEEFIQQNQSKCVDITIKNINRSIQDVSLTVPIHWTFGQLMYIVYENHNQLKNYKFQGLKFMHSGSYVDEEDQILKYQKLNQKEMILYLKVDMNVSDQVVEIQQQKIKLNQKYAVNLLWESYINKLSPFAYNPQEAVQEHNIQKQKLDIEIISSVFPLLHQQTEAILQSSQQKTQSKQPVIQRNQNQDNLPQDLADDNFLARNIPVMLTIYFLVITKFEGTIYYTLLGTLLIYYFIKYQDHRHKMNQIRERREADQRQPNQNENNGNQVNENNPANANTNNQNNDANNVENRANNAEKLDSKTEKQKENIEANVNIELTGQSKNEIQNLEKNEQQDNIPSSQSKNISFDASKEININDNANNNQEDQVQDKKNTEQINNQQQNQENKKTKKKKQKRKGLVLLFLRIKEFVYCFVMSLFPLWYVDLYNKNQNQQNEEGEDEQKQGTNQNQEAQQQREEKNINQENLNDNLAFQQINQNYNRNIANQNEGQNENNQPQQNGGLFDKLNNYLKQKLQDLEEEEKQLRQTIKNDEEQQQQEDSQTKQDDIQQGNEEKTDFEKKND
ncbi:hypothetical protein ABPG72_015106 [Tetrahymena utriculariae]